MTRLQQRYVDLTRKITRYFQNGACWPDYTPHRKALAKAIRKKEAVKRKARARKEDWVDE